MRPKRIGAARAISSERTRNISSEMAAVVAGSRHSFM